MMEVLQNKLQIDESRRELVRKNTSIISSPVTAILRRFGLVEGISVGDRIKSWDVLSTLNFVENHVQKTEPVLDIGCYASEVIVALHRLGYTDLTGADLNANLEKMPHQKAIRYEIVNFLKTKFDDASFSAITSISVIEHGFDGPVLLQEMSRLLKPNGYFLASFDYWPEKIDTNEIKIFGMDWMIFSKKDIIDFVGLANRYGLFPVGELHYGGQETPVKYANKNYTFGWIVLQKKAL